MLPLEITVRIGGAKEKVRLIGLEAAGQDWVDAVADCRQPWCAGFQLPGDLGQSIARPRVACRCGQPAHQRTGRLVTRAGLHDHAPHWRHAGICLIRKAPIDAHAK